MQRELPKEKMKQEKRISKLLFITENEAEAPASYYVIDKICDKYGLAAPSTVNIIEQLEKASYTTAPTHFHRRGIKTNATAKAIKDIIMKEAEPIKTRAREHTYAEQSRRKRN
jgi:tRNA G26 N,N-dimethylase Trm1